jgi:hypothetical protein
MNNPIRILKIQPGLRSEGPRLNLEGKWLEVPGFVIGKKVAIIVEPDKLTITNANRYENEKAHREVLDLTKISPEDVIVQYKDLHDIWRKEAIKVQRADCYYRIVSIPCRLTDLALADLVKAEEEFGHLFFSGVVQYGPNQTIQVRLRDARFVDEQLLKVTELNGGKAIRRSKYWITINVPKESAKNDLFNYLHFGVKKGYWEFQKPSYKPHEIIAF